MIRIQPHCALAFHCLEELPAHRPLQVIRSARFDRCAGPSQSTSKQTSNQTTTSTSGSSSPASSGAGSGITTGAGSPNYAVSGSGKIAFDTSPTVTKQAFDAINALVNQALTTTGKTAENATQTVQNQTSALSDLSTAVLAQAQNTAANTASGGQTNQNSTIIKVLGIVAAAIVALFAFPKLLRSKS